MSPSTKDELQRAAQNSFSLQTTFQGKKKTERNICQNQKDFNLFVEVDFAHS
jgi:hypothetical protein